MADIELWAKILAAIGAILSIIAGTIGYVWRDDRRRIKELEDGHEEMRVNIQRKAEWPEIKADFDRYQQQHNRELHSLRREVTGKLDLVLDQLRHQRSGGRDE